MAVTDRDCIYKRVGLVLGGLSKRVAYQRLKSTHTHTPRERVSLMKKLSTTQIANRVIDHPRMAKPSKSLHLRLGVLSMALLMLIPLMAEIGFTATAQAVQSQSLKITTTKLPVATVAKYYKAQIELSGGIGPYSFSITEGRLPNGLSMSSSGVVSGIPTSVANGAIVVEVSDSVGSSTKGIIIISITSAGDPAGDPPGPSVTSSVALPLTGVEMTGGITCSPGGSLCVSVGERSTSTSSPSQAAWVAYSTDSGATWSLGQLPADAVGLGQVYCLNSDTCIATGGEYVSSSNGSYSYGASIYKTTDGAKTWTQQSIPSGINFLWGISCPSSSICFAAGGNANGQGVILSSSNGGATFSSDSIPSGVGYLEGMSCPSVSFCLATGSADPPGMTITTIPTWSSEPGDPPSAIATFDGGATWQSLLVPSSVGYLAGDMCPSTSTCYATGGLSSPSASLSGTIIVSSDKGSTWGVGNLPSGAGVGVGGACISVSTCLVAGYSSTGSAAELLYSSDTGTNWSYVTIPSYLTDAGELACPSTSKCLFMAGNRTTGTMYISDVSMSTTVTTPTPDTTLGGYNAATNLNQCSSGDAVDCATGDFNTSFSDIAIPGRGPGLLLSRTYNSLAASNPSIFGYGWSCSYCMYLTTSPSGMVTISSENGSTVNFMANGKGGFSSPPWQFASLTRDSSGSYLYSPRGGTTYSFSPNGNLMKITAPDGTSTTLSYNGEDQLTAVTDAAGRTITFSYGKRGHVISTTDPMGRKLSYSYGPNGNLDTVTEPNGGIWRFTYDGHLLVAMTTPDGNTTLNTYDAEGRTISQTDPLGATTTWSYSGDAFSSSGGTTTITAPDSTVTEETYKDGTLVAITTAAGTPDSTTTTYQIDPSTFSTISTTNPAGQVTRYTYDQQGNLATVTNPLGETTSYTYNGLDEPVTVTNPLGETTTYTYNQNGTLSSLSTPPTSPGESPDVTSIFYDNPLLPSHPTSITDPMGNTTSFTYDSYGDPVKTVSPEGQVTTASYNTDGQVVSTTAPRGNLPGGVPGSFTTTISYNVAGEMSSVTNPLGETTRYSYDPQGNLISQIDPAGIITAYSYNPMGELTSTTDAAGTPNATTTSYSYNLLGQLISETNPVGDTTTYGYNLLGELSSMTNPLGDITSYSYNPLGELSSTLEPNGQNIQDTYNAAGELTSVSYPGSGTPATNYTYNPAGYLTSLASGSAIDSYSYEPDGLVASTTDAAGATISYGYDASGHTTKITYPNGKLVSQTYTPDGQLASITDWLGNTTSYTYGENGNLNSESFANGVVGKFSTNAIGELTSLAYYGSCPAAPSAPQPGKAPNGASTEASPTVADPPGPGCPVLYAKSYTYNTSDLLASSTSPTPPGPPSSSSYSYNPLNELTGITPSPPVPGSPDNATNYTYDPAGNLTGVGFANGSSMGLSYNAGSELTAMSLSHPAMTPGSSGPGTLPSPPTPSLVASATFGYNALGERTTESISVPSPPGPPGPGSTSRSVANLAYGYNALGEMTSYNGPMGGSPLSISVGSLGSGSPDSSPQASANYAYDPTGLISSETTTTTGPQGPSCSPPAPLKTSKPPAPVLCATTTGFTWNTASSIPTAIEVGSYYYVYGLQGTPIEQIGPNGSTLSYLANRQGSTVALVDSAGHVVARYAYSAYGSLICGPFTHPNTPPNSPPCHPSPPTPPAACPPAATKSPVGPPPCIARAIAANHFLYDGQYLDSISGLYYLRARWYDPATGQFTSIDALVALTDQPYSYAGNNPINGDDPSGMGSFTCESIPMWGQSLSSLNGCSGVWVYTPLISVIQQATSAIDKAFWGSSGNYGCALQKLGYWTAKIVDRLWRNIYVPSGHVKSGTCRRFTQYEGSYGCTGEGLLYAAVTAGGISGWLESGYFPTYGAFHRASMALAARQQGGSVEGTLAYWYGEMEGIFTPNFEVVVNLATQTFEEGACAGVADICSLITNILG